MQPEPPHDRRAGPAAVRPPPPLDGAHPPLGDRGGAGGHDHERPADLRGVRPLREPRRAVLPESARRDAVPALGPARRLACRGPELAPPPPVAPPPGRPPPPPPTCVERPRG